MDTLNSLKKYHWKSIWAGNWTIMPCSDWGEYYVTTLKVDGKSFVKRVVFIFENGKSSCWVTEEDLAIFHDRMIKMVDGKLSNVNMLANNLVQAAKTALKYMDDNKGIIHYDVYKNYREVIRAYYNAHMPVKYFADALSGDQLEKFLPILEKARVEAESVFTNTILFDKTVASEVNNATGLSVDNLLDLTRDELISVWQKKASLPKNIKERHSFSALIFENKKPILLGGNKAKEILNILTTVNIEGGVVGSTGYPGKIIGRVKIVLDPSNVKDFRQDDVLVTRMTRPEFLPLMKMASGFVTDAGGILSHAAITARELKKPCIIGTKVATQVFKDGDRVEVDADKGIVKKI